MMLDLPTPEALVVTIIVVAVRTLVESSATVLAGVVAAAYLRTLATPERVAVMFRGEGMQGIVRATLVGMALPVCSIGVLPVLRELRRLGLPTGKLLTFGLAAPLMNPLTLVYGLSVLSFQQFALILVATVVVALTVSDVSSRFVPDMRPTTEPRPNGLTSGTRLWNLLVASGRIVTGWTSVDFLLVVLVTALTASVIPPSTFEELCTPSNRTGPMAASLLTLPQYVGPATGIMQLSSVARANLSVPTGLAVYLFGVGFGAGTVFWMLRWYGARRVIALGLATFTVTILAIYASESVIAKPIAPAEGTHGLDGLTRPLHPSLGSLGLAIKQSLSFTDRMMHLGAVLLFVVFMAGIVIRRMKATYRDDDPTEAAEILAGRMSKAMPASQIGAIVVAGLAVFVCLVSYVFFPSPEESIEEMRSIQADALVAIRTREVGWALDRLAAWDAVAAKLPVGAAIRFSFPTAEQRSATRELRTQLLSVQTLVREGDLVAAVKSGENLLRLQSAASKSFLGGPS